MVFIGTEAGDADVADGATDVADVADVTDVPYPVLGMCGLKSRFKLAHQL
jgi:hypothetical protein